MTLSWNGFGFVAVPITAGVVYGVAIGTELASEYLKKKKGILLWKIRNFK